MKPAVLAPATRTDTAPPSAGVAANKAGLTPANLRLQPAAHRLYCITPRRRHVVAFLAGSTRTMCQGPGYAALANRFEE